MAAKYRIPGLQVPSDAQGEALAFFNALKERLELLNGERGDPEQRMVSIRELKDLGIISVRTENQRARIVNPTLSNQDDEDEEDSSATDLDFSLYPQVGLASASGDLQLLVQGVSTSERYKVLLRDLFTLFGRLDQESAPQYPWSWEAYDYGFDITGPAPRFRFVEQAEESDTESALPVDSAIWDASVESGVFEIRLRNDDDDAGSTAFSIGRTALNTDYFRVYANTVSMPLDNAEFQIGAGADLRLFHNGTDSFIRNNTGNLDIFGPDGRVGRFRSSGTSRSFDVGDGTGSAGVVIDGSDANVREVVYATSGVQRWNFRVTGSETGADAGSNFVLVRRDDAGASLGNAFQLVRSSGQARFIDGTALQPAISYLSDPDTGIYRLGDNHLGLAAGGTLIAAALLNGTTRTLTIGDGTSATRLNFNRPAGLANEIAFQTGGIDRWYMRINNSVESGANAGSNFQWLARADDGTALFTVLTVTRANGIVGFNQNTQFADGVVGSPGISFSADSDTGLYRAGANVLGIATAGVQALLIDGGQKIGIGRNPMTSSPRLALGGASGAAQIIMDDTNVADASNPLWWVRSNAGLLEMGHSNRSGDGTTGTTLRVSADTTGVTVGASGTGSYAARINGGSGGNRDVQFNTAGSGRWTFRANSTTESGSSAGSDFQIIRRDDGGAILSTTQITRSTGQWLFGDNGTAALPELSFSGDNDTGIFRQAANSLGLSAGGAEVARVDANATAGQTRFMIYDNDSGTLKRVSVGAADSGGAGFKVLRIPN